MIHNEVLDCMHGRRSTRQFQKQQIEQELGIPKEHTICSSAAIGYIAKESSTPKRKEGTTNIIK